MSAAELLNEIHDLGITLVVDNGSIHCRSPKPMSDELIVRLKTNKTEIVNLLEFRKQRYNKPSLINGELHVSGLLPPGMILEILVNLNAPDDVIERYIGPKFLSPKTWEQWERIRGQIESNPSIRTTIRSN